MLAMANDSAADRPKEMALSTSSLYPVRFGSPRRDSQQSAVTRAQGQVEWSQALHLPAGTIPRAVLHWGNAIVVDSGETMQRFGTNGPLQWSREKLPAAPLVIGNDKAYFVTRLSSLEAVDSANTVQLSEVPISGLATAEFTLLLFWPQALDFVASAYMADPTYDEEAVDQPTPQPLLLADRTVYGKVLPVWHLSQDGELRLPPLYNPDRAEWLVAYDNVQIVNVASGVNVASFRQPVATPLDWSVDAAGTICITGYTGNHKVLTALSAGGEPRWSWTDHDDDDRWAATQPPVQSATGRVFVLTQGRVLAFDAGKLAWSYDARNESLRHGALSGDGSFEVRDDRLLSTAKLRHGTALSDGSILVTGNKTLRHIDANGRRIFTVSLPNDILTPPVVDADGNIYVATALQLFKIR